MQVQERLLHEIVGLLDAAQITGHGALQERGIALKQLAKGGLIARDVGRHQLLVRAHGPQYIDDPDSQRKR